MFDPLDEGGHLRPDPHRQDRVRRRAERLRARGRAVRAVVVAAALVLPVTALAMVNRDGGRTDLATQPGAPSSLAEPTTTVMIDPVPTMPPSLTATTWALPPAPVPCCPPTAVATTIPGTPPAGAVPTSRPRPAVLTPPPPVTVAPPPSTTVPAPTTTAPRSSRPAFDPSAYDLVAGLEEMFGSGVSGDAGAKQTGPTTWQVTVIVDRVAPGSRFSVLVHRPEPDQGTPFPTVCQIVATAEGWGTCTGAMEVAEGGAPDTLSVLEGRAVASGTLVRR